MRPEGTLLLRRRDAAALLSIDECIAAVEKVFKLQGEGKTEPPGIQGLHAQYGGFHIKAGLLELNRPYFAAKTNANFPGNPARHGLPTVQGTLVLVDAILGTPLAMMDANEVTALRTAAASAVATTFLARPDASRLAVIGCGVQGYENVRALALVRQLSGVTLHDPRAETAQRLADRIVADFRLPVSIAPSVPAAMITAYGRPFTRSSAS